MFHSFTSNQRSVSGLAFTATFQKKFMATAQKKTAILCTLTSYFQLVWTACFQLYATSAQRGAHCHRRGRRKGTFGRDTRIQGPGKKKKKVFPWLSSSGYCISNKSALCSPNLDGKISQRIPKALAALRKIQQLKFT